MTCEHRLKTWSVLGMFNCKKKLYKSWSENRKGFASKYKTSKLPSLFRVDKTFWPKPETKYFIVFFSKLVLSKTSVKPLTRSALALRLGKSIFVCMIFRMDTQLHAQGNHEIWCNFLSSHTHWVYRGTWGKFVLRKQCIISR